MSLKLKLGAPKPPKAESPAEPPPSATSTGAPKIKLSLKPKAEKAPKSASSTPAKPARKPKPTPKKRAAEQAEHQHAGGTLAGRATASKPPIKKLKLKTRASNLSEEVKYLKIKTKGKPLRRFPGVGYDSEASDQEEDPTITDNVILRFPPGPECDALRTAVTNKKIGIPKEEGGVNFRMRFFADGRRGWITFQGKTYAMILVDLPCIIEAMKSWEKKMWWKSGDISQMILVLGVVKSEEEAAAYPLLNGSKKGEIDPKTFQYAHGLTPPLRWVRKRRFRKRISVRAVEEEEEEVERLLKADRDCVPGTSRVKLYDSIEEYDRQKETPGPGDDDSGSGSEEEETDEEEDEEGDLVPMEGTEDDDALAAEMEAAMAAEADAEEASAAAAAAAAAASTSTPASATTPAIPTSLDSPSSSAAAAVSPAITALQAADSPSAAAATSSSDADDDDDDESDEDSDGDAGGAGAEDSDAVEEEQEKQRQREEIQDLENAIREQREALGRQTNAILKRKLVGKIESLEADLETRRAAMGMSEGDD